MQTGKDAEQQWQDLALESFFKMVKAPDGDFEAINHPTPSVPPKYTRLCLRRPHD
jgi:hypothetical protein